MKRILAICLAAVLLLCFASCAKDKDKDKDKTTTTATTAASTSAQQSGATTSAKEESTTAKQADISYLYSGYWYQNAENKVVVLQFAQSGAVTVNTFRRNSLANGADAPDSTSAGSFKDNGDGTISVCPDSEQPEAVDIYKVDNNGTLTYQNDDPEGSSSSSLQHFDKLDSDNAVSVLFGDN